MPKPSRAEIATLTELLSAAGLTVRDPGEIDWVAGTLPR
jgi:hypothetical protein